MLVEDGQRVTAGEYLAGDVVCELDSSTLVESAMTQQIKVTGALADLEKADTDLKIQMTTNEKFLKEAELAEALAKLDLATYTSQGGQYEQDLETILAGIKKIEEESIYQPIRRYRGAEKVPEFSSGNRTDYCSSSELLRRST